MKDLGVTRLRSGGRGDLIVHIEVHTPTKLKRDEEELLKKLGELRGEKPGAAVIHSRNDKHASGLFARFRDAFGR